MNTSWKHCVIVGCFLLIGIIFAYVTFEKFDPNLGRRQQSNKDITQNSEIITDKPSISYQEKINEELDNNFGDVLLEWDFDDTGDLLNGGELEGVALHTLKCSKSCCGSQWPLPKELQDRGNACGRDLVRTNYTCANGSGSGCVCVSRAERDMLARRGNNATWNRIDI